MMLYGNTKVKFLSLDIETDEVACVYIQGTDIVAGVLQGDTLAPYLFIICLDSVIIDKMKENDFKLRKERSSRYPTQTITDADNANEIALLANTPAQAETLLHSLERAAAGVGLHINAYKVSYMFFNQSGDISTLNSSSLKLVDKFTYLVSRHQYATSIGMDSYRLAIGHMEVRPDR